MEKNNLWGMIVLALLVIAVAFGGMLIGAHYQEQKMRDTNTIQIQIPRSQVIVDQEGKNKKGRVLVWPFVDVQYDVDKD